MPPPPPQPAAAIAVCGTVGAEAAPHGQEQQLQEQQLQQQQLQQQQLLQQQQHSSQAAAPTAKEATPSVEDSLPAAPRDEYWHWVSSGRRQTALRLLVW